MNGRVTSLLFVCDQNSLRSPMAEAIAKADHGERIFIDSAGVRDGQLDEMSVAVLAEIGIDLSRHQPKRLAELMDTSFDVIVTLSPEAHQLVLDMTRTDAARVVDWPTNDPSTIEGSREVRLAAYRELRDTLRSMIENLLNGEEQNE
ncbi:MAG: arsenate reductase ArsC [Alphaproteobacteria bacterium]